MLNLLSGVIYQVTPLAIYAGVTPIIISIFGTESFGQFSVFMLIQSVFVLAELGLGAAVIREGANLRKQEDPTKENQVNSVIKSVEALFIIIFILSFCIFTGLNPISKFYDIESQISIWIGLAACMRFLTIPYRNFLISQEKHIRLSVINLIWSLIKHIIAIYVSHEISDFKYFFIIFCVISLMECFYYKRNFDRELSNNTNLSLGLLYFSFSALRPVLSYSLWIAYSTLLWVIVAQIDRFVISLKVDLYVFSAYFLVSTAAAALLYISGPISQILLPKWSNNFTSQTEIIGSYQIGFRIISLLYVFVSVILLFYPNELFLFWTQDKLVSKFAEMHLFLFLVINYFSAVGSLINNILIAKKETHYQAKGSTISAFLQSLIVLISLQYGSVMQMLVCLAFFRAFWFVIWSQFIFRTLLALNFLKLIWLTALELMIFLLFFIFLVSILKNILPVTLYSIIFLLYLSTLTLRIVRTSSKHLGELK